MNYFSLQQMVNRIPLLKYRYLRPITSDYDPIFPNETLASIITQPRTMQCEHWIRKANSRYKLSFADFISRPSVLKRQYEQMIPEPLQSHPSVCSFYVIYAAFHLFKFRQEEIAGVHDVNLHSNISNYMYFFESSNFIVQVLHFVCYHLYSLNNSSKL